MASSPTQFRRQLLNVIRDFCDDMEAALDVREAKENLADEAGVDLDTVNGWLESELEKLKREQG